MKITIRGAVAVIAALAFAAAGTACGTQSAQDHPFQTGPPTAPTLTAAELAFVSAMRAKHGFDSGVSDRTIAAFGQLVCAKRQGGASQSAVAQWAVSVWTNMSTLEGENMTLLAEQNLCPALAPVQKWHILAEFAGRGNGDTGDFTVHGMDPVLKVVYSYSGNSRGAGGEVFIVYLVSSTNNADEKVIINEISVNGGKTMMISPNLSFFGGSSRYHLELMAAGSWSFKIMQKY